MSWIDFILNAAGLMLWLNWRSVRLSAKTPSGPSLASAIKGTERQRPRIFYLAWLVALIGLRPLLYWQLGGPVRWDARLPLGPTTFPFRSDLLGRMFLFSIASFLVALGIFYLCLLLLSWINAAAADAEPGQRLVRAQLGSLERWPTVIKILLPLLVVSAIWCLGNPLFVRMGMLPASTESKWRIVAQGAVVGLAAYLALKFLLVAILALHIVNTHVYLGELPFWKFVNTTARGIMRPFKWLPLQAGRIDFAPVLMMAVVLFASDVGQRELTRIFRSLV